MWTLLIFTQRNLKRLKNQQSKDDKLGTVGVVAVDKKGIIVAGTSTGGMTNKLKVDGLEIHL